VGSEYKHYHAGSNTSDGYRAYNHIESSNFCSLLIAQNPQINVLKFWSDYRGRNDIYPTCSLAPVSRGVIGSEPNFNTHEVLAGIDSLIAGNKFLSLTNQREAGGTVFNNIDGCDPSIQNLPLIDESRAAVADYFTFHLFEKAVTRDISGSETVDSMEWVYLQSPVQKCAEGWLWVEIEDFELSGVTNEGVLYVYYWTDDGLDFTDTSDPASPTQSEQVFEDIPEGFKQLRGQNTCVQAIKTSDIINGAGNKLIIGLNDFKNAGTVLNVNVMIGLNPTDVSRVLQYYASPATSTKTENCTFDEIGSDVIFKYKKASIKYGHADYVGTWDNKPNFGNREGWMSTASPMLPLYGRRLFLDGSNESLGASHTQSGVASIGFPNGGANDAAVTSHAPTGYNGTGQNQVSDPNAGLAVANGDTWVLNVVPFMTIGQSDMTNRTGYKMRMPRATAALSGTATSYDGSYTTPLTFSSASFNISLYVGEQATATGGTYNWHDLKATLYKLDTWTLAEYCSTARTYYNYVSYTGSPEFNEGVYGYPREIPNPDSNHIDNALWVDLDFADIEANLTAGTYTFYLIVEDATSGLFNGSLTNPVTDNNGGAGYHWDRTGFTDGDNPQSSNSTATVVFKTEYTNQNAGAGTVIYNYGSIITRAPQIIPIAEQAQPEDYYADE